LDIQSARRDLLAGGIFVAFGLAFAGLSLTYEVGSPLNMGPGYFPLVLGGILALLGISTMVKGLLAGQGEAIGTVPWKAAGLLVVAIIFFGVTVRGLGLIPSLFVTTLLSAFAGHGTRVIPAVLIATGLTVMCVVIFVVALQLRLPLIGSWIPV